MPRASLCGILRRSRRKKRAEGSTHSQQFAAQSILVARSSAGSGPLSAQGLNLSNPDIREEDECGLSITQLSAAPCSSTQASDSETLPISTSQGQPVSDAPPVVQAQRERAARDKPKLPKPYASNVDLWKEALGHLDESGKHNIENLIGEQDGESLDAFDAKSLAVAVQEQIDMAFKTQQHDSRADRLMGGAVAGLSKFLSAVDVAVSFDPVHAALPWAAVRSVLVLLTSSSKLKSQLIAGVAIVASLLAQCDTYQQLYMAPDITLRPSKTALSRLRTSIVQTYTKSQLFLSFAAHEVQSNIKLVAGPFKLGDAESHINELSKCEKQLSGAADNCERHCNLSNRSIFQKLLEPKKDYSKIFQDQIDIVMNRINSKDQTEMLEWISPIPYGRHHNRVKETRTIDTCEWLLRHDKFREWEESSSSTILWLQGPPGAGKTFLTSRVVDHGRALLESSPNQEGFAFFYCDRNEEQRRQPLSVLQSYVRQLSTTVKNPDCIRKQLQDLYHRARSTGSDLGFSYCREQLLESINLYSQTTIVLDALDECEPKLRGEILEVLEYLISRSENGLKVFISSRPDRDIRDRFLKTRNIEIQATDNEEDIRTFVRKEIIKHGNWESMSQDLQNDIVTMLFKKSKGMFQWAFLQINELLTLETESAIRDRLGMLPTNLKTAYDEIYGKIKAYNEHDRTLADRAFKWVACAHKPLSIKGLLSAIRWDSDTDTPDLSDIITESQLLHLCNNLLIIDSQRDVWRFSHLSVAEYFEENHWDLQRVHCHAASVCLKVLIEMYKNVDPDQIAVGESNLLSRTKRLSWCVGAKRQVKLGSSFQEYARDYWMVHTQAQERPGVDSSLSQLLKSFLGSPKESSLQYRAWYLKFSDKHWDTVSVRPDLSPGTVALFAMCRFSFYYILQDWWESAEFDVSMTTYSGYNLLALAAMGGCKHICANLINRGMEVNMQLKHRQHGSALIAAVSTGQIETVKFLVKEAGADVDIQLQSWTYGSALAAAAYEGQIEIVKFLVNEAGANVNMLLECWWHGSALAAAAEAGTLEVVKFLVHEAGADVNMQLPKNAESGSVLGIAACSGHPEVTRFLIDEAGAEVNMQLQNGNWGSALAGAAWAGNTQVIELLLQAGADVNMRLQNGEYGSALAAAARASPHYGEIKLSHVLKKTQHGAMRLLLQAGADVNAQLESGRFGSALIFPIERDEAGDVEFLVNAGLDVNQQVQHGDFGTALAAAAFFGSNKCADILIKAGANVNLEIENGLFRTALQAAQADASKISRRPRRLEEVEQGRAKVVGMIKLYGGTDEV